MAYLPGGGYPTIAEIRAWLRVAATVLPDEQLEVIAAAEQRQQMVLDWADRDVGAPAPDDVVAAFYRRCARHAAAKNIPLGILGADAEYGAVRISRLEVEVDRLEAHSTVQVIG